MAAKKKPTKKTVTKRPAVKKTLVKKVVAKKVATMKVVTKQPAAKKSVPKKKVSKNKVVAKKISWQPLYALGAVMILALTSLFWSLLGANLQQRNADQLVDPALFQYKATFTGALFPSTHTFLIKWPLFYLIKLFGYSNASYIGLTVLATLATIGVLAYIIYRIESRPMMFGTIMLALASVLLLVPAVPAAGVFLPVNFAMLATRNLEYVVFLASLFLLVKSKHLKSWTYFGAVTALTLLITSDKLFLSLSLGGAVLASLVYLVAKKPGLAKLAGRWLLMSIMAGMLSFGLLWLIQATGLTNLSQNNDGSPYKIIVSLKHWVVGGVFVIISSLTNFGANPAYDVSTLKNLPGQYFSRLVRPWGLSYLVNLAVMITGVILTAMLALSTVAKKPSKKPADWPVMLSVLLIFSSLAAVGAFVVTDHYFASDSRYLTIVVIAVFISAATILRNIVIPEKQQVIIGVVLVAGIMLGILPVVRIHRTDKAALSQFDSSNQLVVKALRNHPVTTLAGDYWRVVPIKQASSGVLSITPMIDCTKPLAVLSSKNWQPNLADKSFAYLLSYEDSKTRFPNCSLDQIVAAYGRPNASTLISGKLDAPKELLLFYDHGINKSAPKPNIATPASSTVLPITLNQLPYRTCSGSTIVNVVAHQDDDLLFMNPDIITGLHVGYCIRTVYLTAGDAGSDSLYWTGREKAAETAYSTMLNSKVIWVERIVKLAEDQFAIVANPRGNPRVSLIFMRLPDGNLRGQGFRDNHFQSLSKIEDGHISSLNSVDNQSSYNVNQLTYGLGKIIQTFNPTFIHAQAPYNLGTDFPDHSDHMAAGRLTLKAHDENAALAAVPISYYIGYPVRQRVANVEGQQLEEKKAAFFAYSQYDGAVCHTTLDCNRMDTINAYLKRQYTAE
ncbi:MAG: PIG-L family deacetylase [Candidatus Saccharibacteria bacterium]